MRSRKHKRKGDPDLDILPFLNVMVVLIAFLLVNAVFAAVAVLDVNLPARAAATSTPNPDKPQIALEVMLYQDHLVVNDRNTGPLKRFDNIDGKADFAGMHAFLLEVKARFPDVTRVTLLCESDTSYQRLISAMDAVRYQASKVAGHDIKRPLFPDISIGSAPALAATTAPASAMPGNTGGTP